MGEFGERFICMGEFGGRIVWEICMRDFGGRFVWENLVSDLFVWEICMGDFGERLLWDNCMGEFYGRVVWANLVGPTSPIQLAVAHPTRRRPPTSLTHVASPSRSPRHLAVAVTTSILLYPFALLPLILALFPT